MFPLPLHTAHFLYGSGENGQDGMEDQVGQDGTVKADGGRRQRWTKIRRMKGRTGGGGNFARQQQQQPAARRGAFFFPLLHITCVAFSTHRLYACMPLPAGNAKYAVIIMGAGRTVAWPAAARVYTCRALPF